MSATNRRMQRYRARRKAGAVAVVRIAVTDAHLVELVDAGYLDAWSESSSDEIAAAVQRAWDDLLRDETS